MADAVERAIREAHSYCPCRVPLEHNCCCRIGERAPHCRCCHYKAPQTPAEECKQSYHAAIDRLVALVRLDQAERPFSDTNALGCEQGCMCCAAQYEWLKRERDRLLFEAARLAGKEGA